MWLNNLFSSVFITNSQTGITAFNFFICIISSLIIGFILASSYTYKTRPSKGFVMTLAIIPTIVCVIIMIVNGNLGAGVAVAGAFSLVRFRSVPGTAKEIGSIFIAMAVGLALGMGYVGYAFLITIIICCVNFIYIVSKFGESKSTERFITITIPEDLDYTNIFNDIFEMFATDCSLLSVKTTNMGSMYKLRYNAILKSNEIEKDFIDNLRLRNGNLEIIFSRIQSNQAEL